ncbi:PA2169 family four-helix-bundle protein [Kordia algicida OT-1]|uniref:DUF2383 domain-containing protein n=1 Tax=Kordia algicida OT-1 TaxID=391587 RepID=A9DPT7_9FLAO|nr:PA2169 family four-helix-bundle protein [Kordia algicida]EDP97517.1 hypothetical protein KAOT1_20182 [Kordia algicida OT-1]
MKTYTKEVADKLNVILEKNYDAKEGYKTAAGNVESPILTSFFNRKATQRKEFADQLKSELKKLAQEPEESGSIAGALHRTWMNTKALFSSNNEEAMLEEAMRGEKASLEDYDDVLNSELYIPESLYKLLADQKSAIAYDTVTIKRLEDIQS